MKSSLLFQGSKKIWYLDFTPKTFQQNKNYAKDMLEENMPKKI